MTASNYLLDGGTIPWKSMRKNFLWNANFQLYGNPTWRNSVEEAMSLYAKTKNCQYIDFVLDKACFADHGQELPMKNSIVRIYVIGHVQKLADID